MGLMDFLDKAYNKFQECAPQAMDYMQKLQEDVERKNEQKREELERYKREFTHLKDRELVDAYNSESSPVQKSAMRELLGDRIEQYKNEYRYYSPMSLKNELGMQKSPVKKKAIITLLEELGCEEASDNI